MNTSFSKKRQSRLVFVLTLVLAAGLLYLALRRVNWSELVETLRRGDLGLLSLAVVILSISCVVRALRWQTLLSAEKTLPLPDVFWANMTGYLGNAYLPARAGEVIRSLLIGQRGGISKSFCLATALTERIVDAVILVTFSSIALSFLPVLGDSMDGAVRAMAVVGVAGLAAVFMAPRMRGLIQNLISRLPLSEKLSNTFSDVAGKFLTGAGALQHARRLSQFLLYSLGIWTLDTLTGLATARAFGLSLSPIQVLFLLAAIGIASAIPSTPGYVGVYQFVAVVVLVPFGLSEAQSVAYIFGYQAVNYVVITLWGLLGLWNLRSEFRMARE